MTVADWLRTLRYALVGVILAATAGTAGFAQNPSESERATLDRFNLAWAPNSRVSRPSSFDEAAEQRSASETRELSAPLKGPDIRQSVRPSTPFAISHNPFTDITRIETPEMTLRMRDQRGSSALPTRLHVAANALSEDSTWNRDLRASLRPPGLKNAGFEFEGGFASFRQPELFGLGQDRGVGEPSRWRELESWQAGFSLAPGSGRVKYTGGLAGTRFRNTFATRFQELTSPLLDNPQWETGRASWHRVDGNFTLGESSSLKVFGELGQRSETFRDTIVALEHAPVFGGTSRRFGLTWKNPHSGIKADHWSVDGEEIDLRETSLAVRWKGIAVRWEESFWGLNLSLSEDPDAPDDRYITNEHAQRFQSRIDLSKTFGLTKPPGFVPDSVTIAHTKGTISDQFGLSAAEALNREQLSIDLTWDADNSTSQLGVDRWSRRDLGLAGTSTEALNAQRGTSVMFNHTIWGDTWDASVFVSYDNETRPLGHTRSWSGGASWSVNRKGLPRVRLGIDYDSYNEDDIFGRFQDRGLSLNALVDFSSFLERSGAGDEHRLHLRAFTDYDVTRREDLARQTRVGPTVLVTYMKNF